MNKIRTISLDGLEKINSGGRSEIYQLPDNRILKVYKGRIELSEINRMINVVQMADKSGISVMRMYEAVKTPGGLGVISDYVGGLSLAEKIHLNPDDFEKYVHEFVVLSKQISHTTLIQEEIHFTNDLYSGALNHLLGVLSHDEISLYEDAVNSVPRLSTAVHGDYHLRNVMCDNDGNLFLIDLDDFSCGHPIWDISSMTMAYYINPTVLHERQLIHYSGLNKVECEKFWQLFTKEYFDDLSLLEKKRRIDAAITYSRVRALRMAADLFSPSCEGSGNLSLKNIKKNLRELNEKLPFVKEIIKEWK